MQVSRPPLNTPTKLPYVVVRGITNERLCDFDSTKNSHIFLCTLSALLSNAPALTSQTADHLCYNHGWILQKASFSPFNSILLLTIAFSRLPLSMLFWFIQRGEAKRYRK